MTLHENASVCITEPIYGIVNDVIYRGDTTIVEVDRVRTSADAIRAIFSLGTNTQLYIGEVLISASAILSLDYNFDDLSVVPYVEIGSTNALVHVYLNGILHHQITDMFGNVLESWTTAVDIFDIRSPIIHGGVGLDWHQIAIYDINSGQNVTQHFVVDNNRDLVIKAP